MEKTEILWQPEDLGKPIGGSPHAISACLPTWSDVVGYEEGEERVIGALQCGYPRFFVHPLIESLVRELLNQEKLENKFGLPFYSGKSADRAFQYLNSISEGRAYCYEYKSAAIRYFLVTVPEALEKEARFYWRLSGEGISSRMAQFILMSRESGVTPDIPCKSDSTVASIKSKLGRYYDVSIEDIYLFPSGMSAIYNLHHSISQLFTGHQQVQIGFPYVDTWKTLQTFGAFQSIEISMESNQIQKFLDRESKRKPISAIYCECPSNPMLETPDPELLSRISAEMNSILVIDDTIASSINVDPSPYADVVTTSLSKWFNGFGDLLAGSLILNPAGRNYKLLKEIIDSSYSLDIFWEDLELLDDHSNDYESRVRCAGKNASQLIQWFQSSPYVKKVFFSSKENDPNYAKIARAHSGTPPLISIVLDESLINPQAVYDNLQLSKGPSLGTSWSLVCPYTLLAHYDELEWVEKCGVSKNLIRISCGAEEEGNIRQAFESAIRAALK